MIDRESIGNNFQIFFISKELSNSSQIADIIKLGKKINDLKIVKEDACSISMNYGKRILINSKNSHIKNIQQQDVIEIVDYDPIKNNMLVIGKKHPSVETPVHWIIQKARHDVNVIVKIKNKQLFNQLHSYLPATEKIIPYGTIEYIKEILKTLRKGKNILVKDEGVLFTGFNVEEIEKSLKTIEESK